MPQGSHAQLARQHPHVVLTCPLGSMKVKVKSLSCVLFATPQTVAYQVPLSMGFSRQEYWSGLPFPSPVDLPNPRIKPGSPALQTDALPPKTTAPVVLMVGCLWGLKPLFLVISSDFQSTAPRLGTGVEDLNELWPETSADRQAPIPLFAFLFTDRDCKIQQGWERLPETCLISPPISP